MKTMNFLLGVISTLLLIIVIVGIMILMKLNNRRDCNEKRETIFVAHTAEVYDSLTNRKGISASIDKLSIGKEGDTIVTTSNLKTLWINCPEKEVKKTSVIVKKSSTTQLTKKVTKSVPSVKKESVKKDADSKLRQNLIESILREKAEALNVSKIEVKKDTCSNEVNVTIISNNALPEKVNASGLLKIDLESTKSNKVNSLYSQVHALPSQSFGTRNITQFNYDITPNLYVKEYIEKAKRHLCVGTALASVGAIAYASTWFNEIPTFVEYNGLGAFDPANKYYDHNFHERERLQTLKWVRAGGIIVGVLGGAEVIHGIILLKKADISIAPERITLRYSF